MNLRRYLQLLVRHESAAMAASLREQKIAFLAVAALIVAGFLFLDPFPPTEVRIASGRPSGSYAITVDNINRAFREQGIDATNIHTQGSIDNARLLLDPKSKVNAALIQGGALDPETAAQLSSLGSVAYEPLWIFYDTRRVRSIEDFSDLITLRVGVGPAGGGTRPVLADALRLNDHSVDDQTHFITDTYDKNLTDFKNGKLDAVAMVASIRDINIRQLFQLPHVRLAQIKHADAYTKHMRYLEVVTLPAESIDIARDIPASDIRLLATTTQAVVRPDMHPDLQMLMLITIKSAIRQHQNDLFFATPGKFPNYVDTSIPESDVAKRFYDYGTPVVWRYLPSWLAGVIDRIWVLLVGAFALFYPLSRLRLKMRCVRFEFAQLDHYERMLGIEARIEQLQTPEEKRALLREIEAINHNAQKEPVPIQMEAQYFQFLTALDTLRRKAQRVRIGDHQTPKDAAPRS